MYDPKLSCTCLMEQEEMEKKTQKKRLSPSQLNTDIHRTVWEATLCALSSRLMNVIT